MNRLILFSFQLFYLVNAHSWVETIKCKYLNTTNTGFSRDYVDKNTNGVMIDRVMTNLIEFRNPDANLYMNPKPEYTLTCSLSSDVEITYATNGHVSHDPYLTTDTRERNIINGIQYSRKTYWSIHYSVTDNLKTRKDINTGNSFNNNSGLINYIVKDQSFYDGSCDDFNRNLCIGKFSLKGLQPGNYNFIWYWILDFDPMGGGEEYFSSFDINIVNSC